MNELAGFKCVCAVGYTGRTCDVNINDCSPNPCNATGTKKCVDGINSYKCDCLKGYTGKFCKVGRLIRLKLLNCNSSQKSFERSLALKMCCFENINGFR